MTILRTTFLFASALLVCLGLFLFSSGGNSTAYAASISVPDIMITEITPDTRTLDITSGSPDAFEFIELYNSTNTAINLKNYEVIYQWSSNLETHPINADMIIQPNDTLVVWISSVASASLADFNRNFGVSLSPSQIFRYIDDGMSNSQSRTLFIADPNHTTLSSASYTPTDVHENKGIMYAFPLDGGSVMRKISNNTNASPGVAQEQQVPPVLPPLLITEITPDSLKVDGTSGAPDAFEYIELYNTTDFPILLQNHKIVYQKENSQESWPISANITINAKSTMVIWIHKADGTATLNDFNQNYGTTLTSSQVYMIYDDGMANDSARTISIANSSGMAISTASYVPADVHENKGIVYRFPNDGSNVMRKTDNSSLGTPGSLDNGQVPAAQHVPTGLQASPGTNQVALSWTPITGAGIASYSIYVNGVYHSSVPVSQHTASVSGLEDDMAYAFQVSSVDASGQESLKSDIVTCAPKLESITQESYVPPQTGSFPEYGRWFNEATPVGYIPGLAQNFVPQGIGYVSSEDWYLISAYRQDGKPSMLSVVDASTGQKVKAMSIYFSDGRPYPGHAGGVTVSASNVWISSDGYLYRIPLQDLIDVSDGSPIHIQDKFATGTRSSYATYDNGVLWSGEFHSGTDYPTNASHTLTATDGTVQSAWMTGFILDPQTDRIPSGKLVDENTPVTPDYILSTTDNIQGAAIVSDHRIVLTQVKGGRHTDSLIFSYTHFLSNPADTHVTINSSSVPVWFLDSNAQTAVLSVPPLAEGITTSGHSMGIVFESGTSRFKADGKYPIDSIWRLDTVPKLLITEITPDSLKENGTSGTPDAFEFIELYNTTDSPINLEGYNVIYKTESSQWNWEIASNKTIPAKGTFVIWVHQSSVSATLNDFNQNYGTALTASQVYQYIDNGMSNSSARTISIADADGNPISTASYLPSDIHENDGIQYLYPLDGSINLRKSPSNTLATPGSVSSEQVPAW
ncbi:lamin tail domain-containing protein [Paenibacillus oryzisoli]|uniref:lamin tail domain-containing protein n=1 Tax=Paenibacillus oryzisoli TaxID=1850517 RepID=UPI003D2700F3